MLKAVIFDVDGTLLDSNDLHAEAWRRAFEKFHLDIDFCMIRQQIGKGADQLMPALIPQDLVEVRGEEIAALRADIFRDELLQQAKPFPMVRELFERVRADGKKIALATSANASELDEYVRILGVGDLLEEQTDADDSEASKPEPDIFQAALQKLGCAADEAIVVGDTPYDVQAATKAGMETVVLLSGGFDRAWLEREGAAEVYDDPAHLLQQYGGSLLDQS